VVIRQGDGTFSRGQASRRSARLHFNAQGQRQLTSAGRPPVI